MFVIKPVCKIAYSSLLVYATRDRSEEGNRHRDAVTRIKHGKIRYVSKAVTRLMSEETPHEIRSQFLGDVVLVPAPRSRPLMPGSFWPAELICKQIVAATGQGSVRPLLVRTKRVEKSATSESAEARSVSGHLATIQIQTVLLPERRLVIVDDVTTSGATLLACYSHLSAIYPEHSISAFALVRALTDTKLPGTGEMFQPVSGEISLDGDGCLRTP